MASKDEKREPISLSQGFKWETPVAEIERTLSYARDPRGYLERVKGADYVQQNKDKLCIPTKEDVQRDLYGNGTHKNAFEQHVASVFGKAHGLFLMTGVQAQTIALRMHCDNLRRPICSFHMRSHLEVAEQLAYKHVFGLQHVPLGTDYFQLPTVDDVRLIAAMPVEKRPAVVLLEVPNRELGCATWTFEELQEISKIARGAGIKLHCDGARIWEIEPYYAQHGHSFRDLAALFDSFYVSFYKGLGGTAGAMLMSDDEHFINTAKTWTRRLGGNVVTLFYNILDCERGFNENFVGVFDARRDKMISVVSAIKKATSTFTPPDEHDQPIISFDPPDPTCCQIHTHLRGFTQEDLEGARDRVEKATNIRVFPRIRAVQTPEQMEEAKHYPPGAYKPPNKSDESAEQKEDPKHYMFEWQIGAPNEAISDEEFARGWESFCQELIASANSSVMHQ